LKYNNDFLIAFSNCKFLAKMTKNYHYCSLPEKYKGQEAHIIVAVLCNYFCLFLQR